MSSPKRSRLVPTVKPDFTDSMFGDISLSGPELMKRGMARVTNHTPETYKETFAAAVTVLCAQGVEFTADDVIERAGLPPEGVSRNAVGALLGGVAASGKIEFAGRYAKSKRADRHSGMIRVWRRKGGGG